MFHRVVSRSAGGEVDQMGPKKAALLDAANGFQMRGVDAAQNRQNDALKNNLLSIGEQEKRNLDDIAEAKAKLAQTDAQIADKENRLNAAWDEHLRAAPDPNRYFKNKGAFDQGVFMLGAVLGGLSGALNGSGRNQFLEAAERGRQADIDAQFKAIDMARGKLDSQQREIQAMRQEYGDGAARKMLNSAKMNQQLLAVEKRALENGNADQIAGLEKLRGEFEAKHMESRANAIKSVPATVTERIVDPITGLPLTQEQAVKVALEREKMGHDIKKTQLEQQNKGDDKIGQETRWLADKLDTTKLVQGKKELEDALVAYQKSPETSTKDTLAKVAGENIPVVGGMVKRVVMSDDAKEKERARGAVVNALINKVTGSGGGQKEMERIAAQAAHYTDDAEFVKFVQTEMATSDAREKSIRSGVSPEANRVFDARSGGASKKGQSADDILKEKGLK